MHLHRAALAPLLLGALLLPARTAAVPCDGLDGGCEADGAADGAAPDPLAGTRLQGGGLSCQAGGRAGGAGAAALLPVALLLLARRRAAWAAAALLLAAAPARAQQAALDALHFRPTGLPFGVLTVEGSAPTPHLGVSAGAVLSYAHQPLVLVSRGTGLAEPGRQAGVQSQALMSVGLSLGLFRYVAVGLDVPVLLHQELGDRALERQLRGGDPLRDPVRSGVGDLRLSAKVRLFGGGEGLGVALLPMLALPTGDGNSYLGWGGVSFEGRAILDYRFSGGLLLAANLAFFTHGETLFHNLRNQHELRYGAGLFWPIAERLAILLELFGRLGLGAEEGGPGVTAEGAPLEALVGVRYRLPAGVTLSAGAGLGLSRGYGAPSSRVFAAVGYTPAWLPERGPAAGPRRAAQVRAADRDRDGVDDELDRCPAQAGPLGNMGCPDRDEDGDALVDRLDRCPSVPGPRETLGCPVEALASASPAGPPDASLPPAGPPEPAGQGQAPAVRRQGWRLIVDQPVTFLPGEARLDERGRASVAAVGQLLRERPELRRVLIEAHIDDAALDGPRAQRLSRARAEAVRRLLVRQNVARGRLRVRGLGSSRPLDLAETPQARERNTRVEFIVLQ